MITRAGRYGTVAPPLSSAATRCADGSSHGALEPVTRVPPWRQVGDRVRGAWLEPLDRHDDGRGFRQPCRARQAHVEVGGVPAFTVVPVAPLNLGRLSPSGKAFDDSHTTMPTVRQPEQ